MRVQMSKQGALITIDSFAPPTLISLQEMVGSIMTLQAASGTKALVVATRA